MKLISHANMRIVLIIVYFLNEQKRKKGKEKNIYMIDKKYILISLTIYELYQ